MPSELEYDRSAVRRLTSASFLLLSILILPPAGRPQSGGSAASMSSGVVGHSVTGAVPSATGAVRPFTGAVAPATGPVRPPIGPNLTTGVPDSRVTFHGTNSISGHHRHHDHPGHSAPPVAYGYAVPYAYPIDTGTAGENPDSDYDANDSDDDANYQGGPTVFDRRGSGEPSYVPPVDPVPTPHSADANLTATSPEQPRQPTLLIFKDGRQLELGNYAIIGAILFDLTPGHARRIPLADLDLEATRKQNDDRGITFQLPPQAN